MKTLGDDATTVGESPGLNSGKVENFSLKLTVSKILSISSGLIPVERNFICWAGVGPNTNLLCSKTSFSLSKSSVSASEWIFSLHLKSTSKELVEDFLLCLSDLEHHFHSGCALKCASLTWFAKSWYFFFPSGLKEYHHSPNTFETVLKKIRGNFKMIQQFVVKSISRIFISCYIPIILVRILLVYKRTMSFAEDHKSIHGSSNFILIFLVTFFQIILVFIVLIFSWLFFRIMILMLGMVVLMMSSTGSTRRRLPGWWFSLGWSDSFLFSDYDFSK